jgi:hypothetical protein
MVKASSGSWRRLLPWVGRRMRVVQVVEAADEIPDRMPRNGAIIVGSLERPTWISFDCPCVDHHRVILNLDTRRRPAWAMQAAKPLTLQPSIDEFRGRQRCHYFVRKGKVEWVRRDHERGGW